ncbi:GntR family transcriptional regulator [Amylibacter marinus]|uniref:GntR family transcriptional regulator n=1 Tax=Amylibacter marinus TaxID=1475483 RepID=A0ABQ5VS08_9RHOB|nr:GntR family transcriptional regulator [Amylibacter marinus]GLQ33989.1 GntR family transcriptional regulator [Amylibacter marinus]
MPIANLSSLPVPKPVTATDQVFDALYAALVSLELPPGAKISEVEISKQMGVSRQPVRDAFYRLSELGFIKIRPQRATMVTGISAKAVEDARFIRTGIEVECLRVAIERINESQIAELTQIIRHQEQAVASSEKLVFHELDDQFHQTICRIAGHAGAWNIIRDQKIHMERLRFLSLESHAPSALADHQKILKFIQQRDCVGAEKMLRVHLMRIIPFLKEVQISHAQHFESE